MSDHDILFYLDDTPACIALEKARLSSTRLTPERLEQFRTQILKRYEFHGNHHLLEWLAVIAQGAESVRTLFLDVTERGRYLRSLAPFRAFVSEEERLKIIHRVRNASGRERNMAETDAPPPMTVRDLVASLQSLDPELPVLIPGYEAHWDPLDVVRVENARMFDAAPEYEGLYRAYEPEKVIGTPHVLLASTRRLQHAKRFGR